jgi:hypothetical protein
MKAALAWLQENPNHKLPELLRPLVAAHPEHNDVITAARSWLDQNPSGSQAHEVLVTLITRSDGAEEWMQRGEEALLHTASSGKRSLLVALLIGSKADRQYIERTIELFLAERQIKNKTFLLASLSRALANNIVNALLFLAGQSAREYRRVATKALARGLRTYGNRAQEFLEMSHDSPKEYTGVLLAGCVASEVPGDILNDVLRRWLNTHQRGRGYGAVLKALNAHPSRWQALVELGGLQLGVRRDFKKLEQDGEAPAVDWFDISQRDTPKERADKTGTLGEILMEALARQAREAGSS